LFILKNKYPYFYITKIVVLFYYIITFNTLLKYILNLFILCSKNKNKVKVLKILKIIRLINNKIIIILIIFNFLLFLNLIKTLFKV
jgi:hypothetical protein